MSYNIYENGQLKRIAGNSVMDAALDANSTNGVQNKVVTEAITELNNELSHKATKEWTLQGTATGTSDTVNTPVCNELLINIIVDNNDLGNVNIIIPYSFLNASYKGYQGGSFSSSNFGTGAVIYANTTDIKLNGAFMNTQDKSSTTVFNVYYR